MRVGRIEIMGAVYDIRLEKTGDYPKLQDDNGLAEVYTKELVIRTGYEEDERVYANVEAFKHKVLRHELWHAIFHESGHRAYYEDEELVDLLAVMWPKINKIMEQASGIKLCPETVTDCVYDAGEYCAIHSSTGKLLSCAGKCKDFYAKETKK